MTAAIEGRRMDGNGRTGRLVTVFGGSGFLGRAVVRALAQDGWRIKVATRRPDLAFHLQPLGRVGQIVAVQANVRAPASVAAAVARSDAVVNLVGLLSQQGRQRFDTVQAGGARAIALAARDAGIDALVHVSAIGADPRSPAAYGRTKAAGEAAMLEARPGTVILRPSVVFGPEDTFFNRFATLARMSPLLPLIGGGASRFQPVFVGDVAKAVATALDGRARPGTVYELGGPEVLSFRDLMRFVLRTTGRRRLLVPLPFAAAELIGFGSEIASTLSLGMLPPAALQITRDQVALLRGDTVVTSAAVSEGRTMADLGVPHPESIETIVPTYLYRFRKTGQFDRQPIVDSPEARRSRA